MQADRWEHGSEFHWLLPESPQPAAEHPWTQPFCQNHIREFASGRDAIGALLGFGKKERGWQRLWVPDYFCQEVAESMQQSGLELCSYPDSPLSGRLADELSGAGPRDAIYVLNTFGLRSQAFFAPLRHSCACIIEDHTHDPWSSWAYQSEADYCVVSLRKTLPLPDGSILWSPAKAELPPPAQLSAARQAAVGQKLSAMLLKGLYLQGHPVPKEAFRTLALAGEEHIADGPVSGISAQSKALLDCFPARDWRAKRLQNWDEIRSALSGLRGVRVLAGQDPESVPYSAVLCLDTPRKRDLLRQGLINSRVYPAVLWTLEAPCVQPISESSYALSRCMLSIHCDMRYTQSDMARVAQLIAEVLEHIRDE